MAHLNGSRPWLRNAIVFGRPIGRSIGRKEARVIATCDLCGEPIMSTDSYHITGCSIAHMQCEYELSRSLAAQ